MVDETIVQDIEIGGADSAVSELAKVGDAGEQHFGRLQAAAEKASEGMAGVSTAAADLGTKVSKGTQGVDGAVSAFARFSSAAGAIGTALGSAAASATAFAGRVAVVATAATAAVGGVIALAKSVNNQVHSTDDAGESARIMNTRLRQASQEMVALQTKAVSNARAQSELIHQFSTGAITSAEYGKQLIELGRTQRNEAEDAAKVTAIEQDATRARLETLQQLQKEQEKRLALNSLIKTFGSDLTNSLLRLGNTVEDFWRQFVSGPSAVARAVDLLNDLLERNSDAIQRFYNRIANAVSKIFGSKEGEHFVETLSAKFEAFGESLVTIFEKVIAPAIKGVFLVADTFAEAINGIFGTKITGGALLFVGILLQLTGGFRLLISVANLALVAIRGLLFVLGPWGLLIGIVLTALVLLTDIDWKKFVDGAKKAADDTVAWFAALPGRISQFFDQLWTSIKQAASDAWEWVKQKAQEAWDGIVAIWDGLVAKLAGVWDSIKKGAQDVWQSIVNGFSSAIDQVTGFFDRILVKLGLIKQRAIEAAAATQDLSGGIAGVGGDGTPAFAGGGIVRGPGTSKSDSILARLSRGEFVMQASAVQRIGLGALHFINRMGKLPQFNMGGLVAPLGMGAMIPSFATGGLVSSAAGTGRPIVLNIDGESFNLLTRDGDTADQLGRFVGKRRIGSAGRKPSYHGS